MTNVLDFINAHFLAASGFAVVVMFALTLLSRSGYPELWAFLPKWFDVTTWSAWGAWGRVGQALVTCLFSGGVVLVAGLEDGVLTYLELTAAGKAFLAALGIYHGLKMVAGPKDKAAIAGVAAKVATGALVLIVLGGCAGSFEEAKLAGLNPQIRSAAPPPTARCVSLDAIHRNWGAIGKSAAVLAGAEGVATWPVEGNKAEIGLAIGSGVAAAVAAGSVYISESAGEAWVRECSQ